MKNVLQRKYLFKGKTQYSKKKKLIQSRKTLKRQKLYIGILKLKFEGTKNLDKKNFYRRIIFIEEKTLKCYLKKKKLIFIFNL